MRFFWFPFAYQVGIQFRTKKDTTVFDALTVVIITIGTTLLIIYSNWLFNPPPDNFYTNGTGSFKLFTPPIYQRLISAFIWMIVKISLGAYMLWAVFSKTTPEPPKYWRLIVSFSPCLLPSDLFDLIPFISKYINSLITLQLIGGVWSILTLAFELKKQYNLRLMKSIATSFFVQIAIFLGYAGFLGFDIY